MPRSLPPELPRQGAAPHVARRATTARKVLWAGWRRRPTLGVCAASGIASEAQKRNGEAKVRVRPCGGKFMRRRRSWKRGDYFSLAYSALASFRTGMSGSASFQMVRKS